MDNYRCIHVQMKFLDVYICMYINMHTNDKCIHIYTFACIDKYRYLYMQLEIKM